MRSAEKDLAYYNLATPGPWKIIEKGNSVKSLAVVSVAYDGIPQKNICSGISPKTHNAQFIATSREALPYWINRAMELQRALEYAKRFLKPDDVDMSYIEDVLRGLQNE